MLPALTTLDYPDQPYLGPPPWIPLPQFSDRASQMDSGSHCCLVFNCIFSFVSCLIFCCPRRIWPWPILSHLLCLGLLTDTVTSPWLCWPCLCATCKSAPWLVRALPVLESPLAPGSSFLGEQPHCHCSLTNRTRVYRNCSEINLG